MEVRSDAKRADFTAVWSAAQTGNPDGSRTASKRREAMMEDHTLARTGQPVHESEARRRGRLACLSPMNAEGKIMRKLVIFLVASGVGLATAFAHQQGPKRHLEEAPPDQQVDAITYCGGTYRVVTKEGSPIEYREFDLRFKTDSSADGPPPGTPVVLNAGMREDRGFVIFSAPGEISAFIKAEC